MQNLDSQVRESVYSAGFDFGVLSEEQRAALGTHEFRSPHSPALLVVLHFLTLGLSTFIYLGLKHSRLPVIKEDDFGAKKAIGFMFLPIFNLYWQFIFWGRLVDRVNFQNRLRGKPSPIFKDRIILIPICGCLAPIPYLDAAPILLAFIVLTPMALVKIQQATNSLAEGSMGATSLPPVPDKLLQEKGLDAKPEAAPWCINCGSELKEGAQFCETCGLKVPVVDRPRTDLPAAVQRRCDICGSGLKKGAHFCTNCGSKVVGVGAQVVGKVDASRRCGNCGAESKEGAQFCTGCGFRVAGGGEKAPDGIGTSRRCGNCGAEMKGGMQFCTSCGFRAARGGETPPEGIEASRRCGNCGAEMKEGAQFCTSCGLKVVGVEEPQIPAVKAEISRQCSICGATLKEGGLFCTNCGAEVSGFVATPAALGEAKGASPSRQREQPAVLPHEAAQVDLDRTERIMRVAKPVMYESNAFRILMTPSTATLSDIEDIARRLKREGKWMYDDALVPLPAAQEIEPEDIDDAVARLRDPRQRLREELFWFHIA